MKCIWTPEDVHPGMIVIDQADRELRVAFVPKATEGQTGNFYYLCSQLDGNLSHRSASKADMAEALTRSGCLPIVLLRPTIEERGTHPFITAN